MKAMDEVASGLTSHERGPQQDEPYELTTIVQAAVRVKRLYLSRAGEKNWLWHEFRDRPLLISTVERVPACGEGRASLGRTSAV